MSDRTSSGERPSLTERSLTVDEGEQQPGHDDQQHGRSESNPEGRSTVVPLAEPNRKRSKTAPTNASEVESNVNNSSRSSITGSIGFNFLQSIKDLTQKELYRANPLGLLGKEVISATGTTHCPEPIPPKEADELVVTTGGQTPTSSLSSTKLSPIEENEPQHIHFPLNEEERAHMQRRRSTLADISDEALPPCPGEFIINPNDDDVQPHLFSQPSPITMVADFIPDKMTINVFEVFIYAWGVFAFFFDMVTDLVLAQAYYTEGAYWLFILTLMCVVVPNVTLSVFSLVWYIDGSQLKSARNEKHSDTQYNTSMYDINSTYDIPEQGQRKNSKGSEFIPLHQRRNSVRQHDDSTGEGQSDAYPSSPRQRSRTSDKDAQQQQPHSAKRKHLQFSAATADVLTWIIRIIILVLQLDLCLKYIRGLYYTWKGFQKRHDPKWARFYLTKQILIDADIALLRVFDCFMDSGSQVTLQLYIMLRLGSTSMKFDNLFLKQCLSIVSSLGSLAYALSGYSRCWRHMQLTHSPHGWPKGKPAPQLVSWWSTITQWMWYLFLITPRVLALAMFAATFRSWFWIIIVAHWCGMLFWILRFRTIFCISDQTKYNPREAIFEKCYNLVCSYIFIFCYMNLRKGDTRTHYIGFYTIYYIENIAFSIIYAIHSAETNVVFKYSLVSFVCCGFWIAVLFQFFYYRFLHPSTHVRQNTKRNISAMVRIGSSGRFDHLTKSKSCEDIISHPDLPQSHDNTESIETTSLRFDASVDERWHNRFSKENRQKLILQQQMIDRKVKLTRAQKQLEEAAKRQRQTTQNFLTRISSPFRRSAQSTSALPRLVPIADDRSPTQPQLQEAYTKIYQEEVEDFDAPPISSVADKRIQQQISGTFDINEEMPPSDDYRNGVSAHPHSATRDSGDEMILTAARLTSNPVPSLSASSGIINATTSSVF